MTKQSYVIMLRPAPDYGTDGTDDIVDQHFEHLKKLRDDGRLVMAGRFSDVLIGLVIIEVGDEAEARELMAMDPAVEAGIFHAELYPWRIALQR